MYTKESLSKYPYFEKVLQQQKLENVLDSLTGLVTRRYIIEFAQSLIKEKIPFTFAILDLDHFKFINDTYGHKVGDGVLHGTAQGLIKYLDGYGVAGRFGGDEFLFINFRDLTYDDVKKCIHGMYVNENHGKLVLRKMIKLGDCSPTITGTIGSATYPKDAQDYDGLFALIDKTLYRGKMKGRNCYIIYVEELHKNIQIQSMGSHDMLTTIRDVTGHFDSVLGFKEKLQMVYETLQEDMRIHDLFYIDRDMQVYSVKEKQILACVSDIDTLMTDDLYTTNEYEKLAEVCPGFHAFLKERLLETLLIVKMQIEGKQMGYLMCAEYRRRRIWQEDECVIMFYAARMFSEYLYSK